MTELTIRPDEIRDALQKFVADYKPSAASVEEVGRVSDAGDGKSKGERGSHQVHDLSSTALLAAIAKPVAVASDSTNLTERA